MMEFNAEFVLQMFLGCRNKTVYQISFKYHSFWKGFFHGCYISDTDTVDGHPTVTPRQEYNRMSDSFRVTAKCADGYHGKAKARFLQQKNSSSWWWNFLERFGRSKFLIYLCHLGQVQMCSKPETPYELSGCKPIICVAPKEIETYSYLGVKKGRWNASSIACWCCVNLTACLVWKNIYSI